MADLIELVLSVLRRYSRLVLFDVDLNLMQKPLNVTFWDLGKIAKHLPTSCLLPLERTKITSPSFKTCESPSSLSIRILEIRLMSSIRDLFLKSLTPRQGISWPDSVDLKLIPFFKFPSVDNFSTGQLCGLSTGSPNISTNCDLTRDWRWKMVFFRRSIRSSDLSRAAQISAWRGAE